MPREIDTYRPTLESLKEKADKLYPGRFMFYAPEVAKLLGVCNSTVYDRGYVVPKKPGYTTLEELAFKISHDVRGKR